MAENHEYQASESNDIMKAYSFLWGLQIIILTFRAIGLFSTSRSLGILVKAIKLMAVPIVKLLFIYALGMAGIIFGLWAILVINKCAYNPEDPECEDFQAATVLQTMVYVFQIFIGSADFGGTGQNIDEEPFAIIVILIGTLFGTIILTNLLIALMNSEYENVKELAKEQVVFNKAELAFDLSRRTRLMPPPFNVLVFVLTFIIDVIWFIPGLIHPRWLHYSWIDQQIFFNLQEMNIWQCKKKDDFRQDKGNKVFNSRWKVCRWYFCGWWFDWILIKCCKKKVNSDWKIHHKSCYGDVMLQVAGQNRQMDRIKCRGITLQQYAERHERRRKRTINIKARESLNMLTKKSLFCRHCYKPFQEDKVMEELTTSYIALLDYVSAWTFVLIPIAWIPLILLFGLFVIWERIVRISQVSYQEIEFTSNDFDAEYFPKRVSIAKK